uniref:Uncharacterized protein n=1 Tax=Cyanistes caeruleus TaxID=156563 RepID=A0A8C0UL38_CYACU
MSEETSQGSGGSPLLLEDINPSGRDQTSRALTDRVTRTRSRRTAIYQKESVEENEAFLFSPPLTKLTKKFEGRCNMFIYHPVQFKDLDPDLSSQFVFSPPLLRSRRKNVSTKEEEDTKSIESGGKQKLKRGRTPKSKMKKASKYEISFEQLLTFLNVMVIQLLNTYFFLTWLCKSSLTVSLSSLLV